MDSKPNAEEGAGEPKDKYQYPLTEMLRKALLAAIGAAAIAQDEIEALVNRLVERGEIAERDGKILIHEMKDKRKSKTTKIEDEIDRNISNVLDRMNIPTKADVDALNVKIAELSKKLDEMKKPGGRA